MTLMQVSAVLISLAALFGYVNHRFVRLPTTIGIMLIAILMSLGVVLLGLMGFDGARSAAATVLSSIDFNATLLNGMLSFLLFAGALHIDLSQLAERKWSIGLLATVGLVLTTFIVGGASWGVFRLLSLPVPFLHCLLFGALIAPTDPVAVLGILRRAGVSGSLQTMICGESLFNDGIAVVVFIVLLEVATGGHDVAAGHIALLFVEEVFGGLLLGLALGGLTFLMLRSVDNYQVEVLLTLALVMGGYALATALHTSGPIAMVTAGLLIGNHGRYLAMSDETRGRLDAFWELIDEVLNAVLFLLVGLEVLVIALGGGVLAAGLAMIPVVLLARLVSVAAPVSALRRVRDFPAGTVRMLTWGGLHGGISVALALSLPPGETRDVILTVTYVVVVFSILVQGLTVGRLSRMVSAGDTETTTGR